MSTEQEIATGVYVISFVSLSLNHYLVSVGKYRLRLVSIFRSFPWFSARSVSVQLISPKVTINMQLRKLLHTYSMGLLYRDKMM